MRARPNSPRRLVLQAHRRLLRAYGEPATPRRRGDAVAELVNCILSQHTSDLNRDRAYATLRARFSSWAAVRDAPQRELVAAIRTAGLANQKAPRIQGALREITRQRGRLTLDFLKRVPVDGAKRWLRSLHGVGPKTAAITLLFALGRPAFPVDTHVFRVSRRLGWIPTKTTSEQAHDVLEALIPPRLYFPLHINLVRHGRAVCQARRPRCEQCPLADLCAYYLSLRGNAGNSRAKSLSPKSY